MKITTPLSSSAKGSSLIEAVIAVGVLAVAVPLVFGTMAQTGDSSLSSQAETRCSWIVPTCVEELQHAMRGESEFIDQLSPGKDFPAMGALSVAFSSEGKILGKVNQGDYDSGIQEEIANERVRYIAAMSGVLPSENSGDSPPTLTVKVVIEYPAAAPAAKRQKIEFYTRLP